MDETKIKVLTGANMDVDLVSENVGWDQSICPKFFCGIKYLDGVLCSFPYDSKDVVED